MIERIGKIGFTCAQLFIMNYFHGLEVTDGFFSLNVLNYFSFQLGYNNVRGSITQIYPDVFGKRTCLNNYHSYH